MDVERCRESRTQYLGPFTFAIVALTVSFILLNDAAGDMIVDNEISSFISAFILANAYLYMYSIVVFMIVYLVIAGILVYFIVVYLPAKKTVVSMKATTRAAAEAALAARRNLRSEVRPVTHMRLRRTPGLIFDNIYADMKKFWQYVATAIVYLSPAKAKEIKLKRSKPWKEMWMHLNIPSANHGQVLQKPEVKKASRRRSSISRHMVAYTANTIPRSILVMRPPSWLEKWTQEDEVEFILEKVSQRLFGTEPYIVPSDKARALQKAVLCVSGDVTADLSQRITSVTSNVNIAVDRIIRRLTSRELDVEGGFDVTTGKFQTTAILLELFEKFSEIWCEFLPCGHELTPDEIGEVTQMFLSWTVGSGVCQGEDRVGVDSFRKWFVGELYPFVMHIATTSVPSAEPPAPPVRRERRRSIEWGEQMSLSHSEEAEEASGMGVLDEEILSAESGQDSEQDARTAPIPLRELRRASPQHSVAGAASVVISADDVDLAVGSIGYRTL
jgi:hypothetical protein